MNGQHEQDLKRMDEAIRLLEEHFETVQIFTTRYDGGEGSGTTHSIRASGNFYARYGQIKHWLIAEEEATRNKARNQNDQQD